jgi:hypothetical protein
MDGRTWQTIDFRSGNGTTQVEQVYSFIDEKPLHGNNYCRLRQVDFDGRFKYSAIRIVTITGDEKISI